MPLIKLLEELKSTFPIDVELPKVHCIIFEDNNYCIELDKYPKMIYMFKIPSI